MFRDCSALILSERLESIASRVSEGAVLADIGTDHAMLPMALCQRSKLSLAYGLDVSSKALNAASKRLDAVGSQGVTLRLSNGLSALSDEECAQLTCVTIAGVGGVLMLELLQAGLPRCPMLRQVIVQPNRDRALLRHGLSVLGWRLDAEEVVADRFQTLVWTPGIEPLNARQCALGPRFLEQRPPGWLQWLQREQSRLASIKLAAGAGMPPELNQQLNWVSELLSSG